MKSLLSSILTLLVAPSLFADVVIYRGSLVTKTTSADGTRTTVSRMIEIATGLVISTPILNLDCKLSATANNAGHITVDAALADVKAALLAAGYAEKP